MDTPSRTTSPRSAHDASRSVATAPPAATCDCAHSGDGVNVTGDDLARALARADELERELDQVRAAMKTRNIIGQAQGLLMARHDVDATEAFAMLVRLSQRSGVKLRDVAARVVQTHDESRVARPARRRHD